MLRYYTGIKPTGREYDYIAAEEWPQMRVPDVLKDCVCFLCFEHRNGHGLIRAGTGFFIGEDERDAGVRISYTVTAWHVILHIKNTSKDGKVLIRSNTHDGGFDYTETLVDDWVRHPTDDTVDVAVLGSTPRLDKYAIRHYDLRLLITEEIARDEDIGIGDDVFITGMFQQKLDEKNYPILRQGTIAKMPENKIAISLGSAEVFLIEVRSLGGLSGSPAFVYLSGSRRHLKYKFHNIGYLLGVVQGHYVGEAPQSDELVDDSASSQQINIGIAFVVPATKIIETLDHPRLVQMREERKKQGNNEEFKPVEDVADNEDIPEFTEEDFEEVLRKVSKPSKKKQSKKAE